MVWLKVNPETFNHTNERAREQESILETELPQNGAFKRIFFESKFKIIIYMRHIKIVSAYFKAKIKITLLVFSFPT